MDELPPEDQPDVIYIGPVGPIPVFHDDDPRLDEDRAAWSAATAKAQAMHSPEELLEGLRDPDWRVRHEVIDRLIARGREDRRTLPALLQVVAEDEAWEVRGAATIRLGEFEAQLVRPTLLKALEDPSPDVRWATTFALGQLS